MVPNLRRVGLRDYGILRRVRLRLTAPPPASPDSTPAYNTVNYSIVSARYRCEFSMMLRLRP